MVELIKIVSDTFGLYKLRKEQVQKALQISLELQQDGGDEMKENKYEIISRIILEMTRLKKLEEDTLMRDVSIAAESIYDVEEWSRRDFIDVYIKCKKGCKNK